MWITSVFDKNGSQKRGSASEALIRETVYTLYPALVITAMVQSLTSVIDNFCASYFVGVEGVAAIGISLPLTNISWIFIHILSKGSQITAGKKIGNGELEAVNQIFNSTLVLTFAVGCICCALIFYGSSALAAMLGAPEELNSHVSEYIRGLSFNLPLFLIYTTMAEFLPFDGGEKRLVGSIVAISVGDTIFNLILVGKLGLGMFGLGLATSCSTLLGILGPLLFLLHKNRLIVFRPGLKGLTYLKEAVSTGLPGGYFEICCFVLPVCINHLLRHYAPLEAISAMAIAGSVRYFMKSFIFAQADIISTIGSVYYGERDAGGLVSVVRQALTLGFKCYISVAVLVAIFAPAIISGLAGGSSLTEQLAYPAVILTLIQLLFLGGNLTFIKAYQIQGKHKLVSMLNLAVFFLIPLGYCVVLIPCLGAWGLWLSWPLTGVTALALFYLINLVKQHKIRFTPLELLTFGDKFEISEQDRISLSLATAEQVIAASAQINCFCLDHGIKSDRAYHYALTVEEMCVNILEHGRNPKQRDSRFRHHALFVNLTFFYQQGVVHICIRDNGRKFNPVEYAKKIREISLDHLEANLGLRLVTSIAREISYRNIFHLNVVNIVI